MQYWYYDLDIYILWVRARETRAASKNDKSNKSKSNKGKSNKLIHLSIQTCLKLEPLEFFVDFSGSVNNDALLSLVDDEQGNISHIIIVARGQTAGQGL